MKFVLGGVLLAAALAACGDNRGPDCDTPGNACTWIGKPGVLGFNGDGNDRLATELYWTMDASFAADGTMWFIDWNNHLVRHVKDDDTIETLMGWTDPVFPGDGVHGGAEKSPAGAVSTDVQLNHPTDLVQEPDGKILVMAWHNHKLRELDPVARTSRILAGGGAGFAGDGGPMAMALFKQPKALERAADGTLYISDQQNFRVRKIDPSGMVSTIAGAGMQGTAGDDGPAAMAQLDFSAGSNPEPTGGLLLDGTRLYVADTLANRIRVIDLTTGTIAAFAGTGEPGYSGDGGPAAAAQLTAPRDMEKGPDGDLYIADTDNSVIRAISHVDGTIRTVAGTGAIGLDGDEGLPATEMPLARPFGIEFDPSGNLFIADTLNSRFVRVAQ